MLCESGKCFMKMISNFYSSSYVVILSLLTSLVATIVATHDECSSIPLILISSSNESLFSIQRRTSVGHRTRLLEVLRYDQGTNVSSIFAANKHSERICHNYVKRNKEAVIRCQSGSPPTTTKFFPPLPKRCGEDLSANFLMELSPFGEHLLWSRTGNDGIFITNIDTATSLFLPPYLKRKNARRSILNSERCQPVEEFVELFRTDWFRGQIFTVYSHKRTTIMLEHFIESLPYRKLEEEIVTPEAYGSAILGLCYDSENADIHWITEKMLLIRHSGDKIIQPFSRALDSQPLPIHPIPFHFFSNSTFWLEGAHAGAVKVIGSHSYGGCIEHIILPRIDSRKMSWFNVNEDSMKDKRNPCDKLNCTHICLPAAYGGKFRCACPSYLTLSNDNMTCVGAIMAFVMIGRKEFGYSADQHEKRRENATEGVIAVYKTWGKNPAIFGGETSAEKLRFDDTLGLLIRYFSREKRFCYFIQNAVAFKCYEYPLTTHSSIQLSLKSAIRVDNYTAIFVSEGIEKGFRLWLSDARGCVKVYVSASDTLWSLPCIKEMIIPRPPVVVIDEVRWEIFWHSDNGSLHVSNLWSRMTLSLTNVTHYKTKGRGIALDPVNKKVYWLSEVSVNAIGYDGNASSVVYRFPSDVRWASSIAVNEERLYLIEHGETQDNVVTFDFKLRMKQYLVQGPQQKEFRHLAVNRAMPLARLDKSSRCSHCSHFCQAVKPNIYRCRCPIELPILLHDNDCTDLKILTASSDSTNGIVIDFLPSNDNEAKEGFPLLLNDSKTVNALDATVFAIRRGVNATICWTSAIGVTCSIKIIDSSTKTVQLGDGDSKAALIAIGSNGHNVYWYTKVNQTRCLSLTSLKLNASLTNILCTDFNTPLAIDTFRHVMFWCDDASVIYSHIGQTASRKTVYLGSYHNRQKCTSLSVDELNGRLFIILGKSILSTYYKSLTFETPLLLHEIRTSSARGLHYHSNHLFWIVRNSRDEDFIEYLHIRPWFQKNRPNSSTSDPMVHRIARANALLTLFQITVYEPSNEDYLWPDPCSKRSCTHFCIVVDPLPPQVHNDHTTKCACPSDYTLLTNETCTKISIVRNHSARIGIAVLIALVLFAVIIFTVISVSLWCWCQNKETLALLPDETRNGFLVGDNVLAEQSAEEVDRAAALPFTDIIQPKDLRVNYTKKLGKGNFGVVYPGKHKETEVAVKIVLFSPCSTTCPSILREIKIMAYVKGNENIVYFIGAEISELKKGKIKLVMELSPQGSLQGFLQRHRVQEFHANSNTNLALLNRTSYSLSTPSSACSQAVTNSSTATSQLLYDDLHSYALQIVSGMSFLESKNIVHGDLATRNVLVFQNGRSVKISDFGLSKNLYDNSVYKKRGSCGLPFRWAAVETLEQREFSIKSDVWSYGVTVWEICTLGKTPFANKIWDEQFVHDLKHEHLRLPKPDLATDELYQLILKCCKAEPRNRPTFHELVTLLRDISKFPIHSKFNWVARLSISTRDSVATTSGSTVTT